MDLKIKNNIDVKLYHRRCSIDPKPHIKRGAILVDHGNEYLARESTNVAVVPCDATWVVVEKWENAIFIDDEGIVI